MNIRKEIRKKTEEMLSDALSKARGISVSVTGETKPCEPKNNGKCKLKELQSAVGGYIELTRAYIGGKSYLMAVEEDGLPKRRPLNIVASNIQGLAIVGNVVIFTEDMIV